MRVIGPDNRHAEVHHGDRNAVDRSGSERPVVQISTFNKDVREAPSGAQPTDLGPKSASDDGEVEIPHGLSLDDASTTKDVIACRQQSLHDSHPRLRKQPRDAAAALVDVSDNAKHVRTVADPRPQVCDKRVPTNPGLALSPSESA